MLVSILPQMGRRVKCFVNPSAISMEVHGAREIEEGLRRFGREVAAARAAALKASAKTVWGRARDYAPISPTQAQKKAARKTRRKVRRKATATTRAKPGGLVRSIEWYAGPDYASVFVAANSDAGAYAKKIHDEKGKTWHKRGLGTVAKGGQADDKFIDRALTDAQKEIDGIFAAKFARVGRSG